MHCQAAVNMIDQQQNSWFGILIYGTVSQVSQLKTIFIGLAGSFIF